MTAHDFPDHTAPTIPAAVPQYPDARDNEYHSGAIVWGFLAWLGMVTALIGLGLYVWGLV